MSSDVISAFEQGQICLHVVLREGSCVAIPDLPIANFLGHASTCLDCNVVLQIIEVVQPGWVTRNKKHGLVDYKQVFSWEDPLTIVPQFTLHVQQSAGRKDVVDDSPQSASFHFVRRAATTCYEGNEHGVRADKSPDYAGKYVVAQSLEVTPDSGSRAAFARAHKWLSYCDKHDGACKPPNPEYKPRRLINVGSVDGVREPFLFEPVEPVRYACLSYCWGKDLDQLLTTTSENIQAHFQAIAFSALPRTIQDAITVCRNLNIPNIWVDSLCIVQDDRLAWLQDASTMHDIYYNSYLTISVMEPNSCKLGFLGKQRFGDPTWQQPLCVTHPDEASSPVDLLIRPRKFYPRSHRDRSSLDRRGWCLQESLLPSRRLCYDGNEMIWECLCRKLCECGHAVAPQVPRNTTPDHHGKLGALLETKAREIKSRLGMRGYPTWYRFLLGSAGWLKPRQRLYQRWRELISDYSHRSLSQRHDRLRAISGLAKMVWDDLGPEGCKEPGDYYLAGLWKQELPFDLTWEVEDLPEGAEMPERGEVKAHEAGYHIPSWSWASLERPVSYKFSLAWDLWRHEPVAVEQCIVERACCQHELPEDPTSAVIDGSIVLTNDFAPVQLVRKGGKDKSKHVFTGRLSPYERHAFVQCPNGDRIKMTLDQPEANSLDSPYYCLKLFSWVSERPPRIGPRTWFLVLAASMRKPGAFERRGVGLWVNSEDGANDISCPIFEGSAVATVEIV
ncbi:hypothetical protein ASPBRDRAFT_257975 [Aspergillus brasiliensis CBS 101740]|uniref:Heterokaryon incompatibility domain-containing protein n=1 Tax=Aspergillus brasiliensis (strain CBS 101740 / IMI 381727 / IBT 21946) TaxID=767769 RepID=A0A1L9V2M0_ASPBC|nr:hypothetical protein ASPBRDRAFT_257975 [Aspergillus brasiliensis CBS 101740]